MIAKLLSTAVVTAAVFCWAASVEARPVRGTAAAPTPAAATPRPSGAVETVPGARRSPGKVAAGAPPTASDYGVGAAMAAGPAAPAAPKAPPVKRGPAKPQ